MPPNLNGFETYEAYYGDDHLQVGKGKGLPFLNIGLKQFYSPHKTFSLNNILHAHDIKKHWLFVQLFCFDNNVFFEFYSTFFVVRDESTHLTLLTGPSDGVMVDFTHFIFQIFS